MTEKELDEIIRLIPLATVRQTEVLVGQIDVHLTLLELERNLANPYKLVEKEEKTGSKSSI